MSQIKILTLNVCFELPATYGARFSALIRMLKREKYGIVCLQECVPDLYSKITRDETLVKQYHVSPFDSMRCPYGTLMMVSKALGADIKFIRRPFRSQMGRDLLSTEIKRAGGIGLTVGTVHLESEESRDVRESQMQACEQMLRSKANVVVMGDFNFPAHRNYRKEPPLPLENDNLARSLHGYTDAWPILRGADPGYTFDHARNQWKFSNPARARGGYRFDRVVFRLGDSNRFSLTSMKLVGAEPIGLVNEGTDYEGSLYISDHLGIEFILQDSMPVTETYLQEAKATASKDTTDGTSYQPKRAKMAALADDDDDEIEFVGVTSSSTSQVGTTQLPTVKADNKEETSSHYAKILVKASPDELDTLNTLLGDEPSPGHDIIQVALRAPSGARVIRRFRNDDSVETLYWWACLMDPSLLMPTRRRFSLLVPGTESNPLGDSESIPSKCLREFAWLDRSVLRVSLTKHENT